MQQKRNRPNKGIILASGSIRGKSPKQWLFPAVGWDERLQTPRVLPNRPDVPFLVVTTVGSVGGECKAQNNWVALSLAWEVPLVLTVSCLKARD